MFTPSQYQVIGAAKAALVFGILFVIGSCLRAEPLTTGWERKVAPKAPVVQAQEKPSWLITSAPEKEQTVWCVDPYDSNVRVACDGLRR